MPSTMRGVGTTEANTIYMVPVLMPSKDVSSYRSVVRAVMGKQRVPCLDGVGP